jgi:hypothetical protein
MTIPTPSSSPAATTTPEPTTTFTLPPDPVAVLLQQPLTVKLEQYVSSGLLALSFILTNLHVGFHVPAVTQATIDAVSVVGFVVVNVYVWVDKRVRHTKAAALHTARVTGASTSSEFRNSVFDRTV